MVYTLFAILLFGVLIGIHEFGHFIVAKACGVQVNEFSIGMGPLLWKKQGKETLYSLRLLPIGGFCAMEGEDEDSGNPRAFGNAAAWKQFLILAAGAAFNFLIGVVLMLIVYAPTQAYVTPTIVSFEEGNPAAAEEYLHEGDTLYSIDGSRVLLYNDVSILFQFHKGDTMDLVVLRDGKKVVLNDTPLTLREYEINGQKVMRYGLSFGYAEAGWGDRLRLGTLSAIDSARMVWWSLRMLFNGEAGLSDMSGPIGIVDSMAQVGEQSANVMEAAMNLLYFGGFIAINLAVMNLLPIPALDGGRIFFLLVNAIMLLTIKKRIPAKYEGLVHGIGMAMLLALMAVVAFQDIYRVFFQ